jgi:hypothetical protein
MSGPRRRPNGLIVDGVTDIVLGVLGGVLLVAVLVVSWRALRVLRRRIAAARARIAELQAKVMTPGPRRDAALLRLQLQAEMRSTREMLEAAPDGLIFRANATSVLAELATTAGDVDRELAAIAGFADERQQRAALADLRPQAQLLIDTTYAARQTILRTAVEDRAHRLTALQQDVAREAAALEVYRKNDPNLQL